jgi:hypothetical protein
VYEVHYIAGIFYVYILIVFTLHRHTGITVYGKEYFFGSGGIEYCPPVSIIFS